MQNNLKKLEQKMAILEAVLKEGSQSTTPKELSLICKEADVAGGETITASGEYAIIFKKADGESGISSTC